MNSKSDQPSGTTPPETQPDEIDPGVAPGSAHLNLAPGSAPGKDLPPAAIRALKEAAARRAKTQAQHTGTTNDEKGGPGGPEPTRYGDWERKGRAVDFS